MSQLTERALFERQWRQLPQLGRLLGELKPSQHWYGATTAHETSAEQIARLLEIYSVVCDQKHLLNQQSGSDVDKVLHDLKTLSRMFLSVSEQMATMARDVDGIAEQIGKTAS